MGRLGQFSSALLATTAMVGIADAQTAAPVFAFEGQQTFTADLTPQEVAAIVYNSHVAGAVIDLCWENIEPNAPSVGGAATLTLGTSWPCSTSSSITNCSLATLAHYMSTSQKVIIGLKAGECAPVGNTNESAWLANAPFNVPIALLKRNPWHGTPTCSPVILPASWDSTFGTQYLKAVSSLWSVLGSITLTADGSTLLSHVLAFSNGAIVRSDSGEMGVDANGCSLAGTAGQPPQIIQTPYQTAEVWTSIPPPDNYTPTNVISAYGTIFNGLLNIIGPTVNSFGHVAITQGIDGSDATDWPAVDTNGVLLPPQTPPVAATSIYQAIISQSAAESASFYSAAPYNLPESTGAALSVFGWVGLYLDTGAMYNGVALTVSTAASSGGGIKWQFNNDTQAPQLIDSNWVGTVVLSNHVTTTISGTMVATSCNGREDGSNTPTLATASCFGSIVALAEAPTTDNTPSETVGLNATSPFVPNPYLLQWLEVAPQNLFPLTPTVSGPAIEPMYGCFYAMPGSEEYTGHSTSIGPSCP